MQIWVNEHGQMLTVTDVTKIKDSKNYRKRLKHGRYVVGASLTEHSLWLEFDCMADVCFWLKLFGFEQKENNNAQR